MTTLTRRQALAAAASTTALSACTLRSPAGLASASAPRRITEAQASALLDSVAENLLRHLPRLNLTKRHRVCMRIQAPTLPKVQTVLLILPRLTPPQHLPLDPTHTAARGPVAEGALGLHMLEQT